jgi:hypothetical protein
MGEWILLNGYIYIFIIIIIIIISSSSSIIIMGPWLPSLAAGIGSLASFLVHLCVSCSGYWWSC